MDSTKEMPTHQAKLTLMPLGVRDGREAGVGLGAFRLFRLVMLGSAGVEPREEADENRLLGRAVFLAG